MKYLLRLFLIHLLSLWFLISVNRGFSISGNWQVLIYAAFLLTIIAIFVKPILKLLFLPLNMITLGFFSWVVNIALLYILVLISPQIHIQAWNFPGTGGPFFTIPAFRLSQTVNFIVSALLLAFTIKVLRWITH